MTGDSWPTIRFERHLPDPPGVVWRALTDGHELALWFPCAIDVDGDRWEPGARLTFRFTNIDLVLTGRVLAAEEPHLLEYTWGEETLRFELTEKDGGTVLVLADTLPPAFAARNSAGWDECLDRLGAVPLSAGTWQEKFDRYRERYEGDLGGQEGPPAGMKV